MPRPRRNNLDSDGIHRLNRVLGIVGDDTSLIDDAIATVLWDISRRSRSVYLRGELKRRATKRINRVNARARKKAGGTANPKGTSITRAMILDAPLHERELMEGIPEHDR